MKRSIQSDRLVRQRRFLMIAPLLTLPFITLMFWAFGGGKGKDEARRSKGQTGLNMQLPEANFKNDATLNKLSFYNQAALDSAKIKAAEKLDPYRAKFSYDSGMNTSRLHDDQANANKRKVYDKLEELKRVLDKPQQTSDIRQEKVSPDYSLKSYTSAKEIDRLQFMMQRMKEDKVADPEMEQINDMLDKIQAIQHPDKAGYAPKQAKTKSYAVRRKKQEAGISLMKADSALMPLSDTLIPVAGHNAFYGLTALNEIKDPAEGAIECLVPETQAIVAGATVKLALSNDVTVNNVHLPQGTLIYGTASLSNERLRIKVGSIRYGNTILPVALDVYDMDGQEGIYIPGSISRTVAKESSDKAISSMNVTTLDPSLGAQAAGAGIEAAKTLFSKKVRMIRMTVMSGYKILLKERN